MVVTFSTQQQEVPIQSLQIKPSVKTCDCQAAYAKYVKNVNSSDSTCLLPAEIGAAYPTQGVFLLREKGCVSHSVCVSAEVGAAFPTQGVFLLR